jgi:fucose permease
MTSGVAAPIARDLRAARNATYVAFSACGFAFASWASRIPQVRDGLGLNSAQLGLVLLAIAVGSLIALPLAGLIVHRLSSRTTVMVMSGVLGVGLVIAAVGYLIGVVPVLVGLLLIGFGNGAWDVAMNVQGADVERRLGRSIMSRFHAGYSLGTVGGAAIGAAMVALHVPVTAHLIAVAVAVLITVPIAVRHFLPDTDHAADEVASGEPKPQVRLLTRWREPRTLLIGLFVFAFAFAEGTGQDWIAVALIDDRGTTAAAGTLGFATFLAAMTLARWFGTELLDRFGRVPVVRALALVSTVGLLLFIFAPATWLCFVGALLWGLGTSLGFPVGMSAASDDPAAAATRVSVVASIGYCAFLSGPPLIGLLGQHITVSKALTVVAAMLALAALIAGALRPLPSSEPAEDAVNTPVDTGGPGSAPR